MILSKNDLKKYLDWDRRALVGNNRKHPKIFGEEVWKFQIALRKLEYYENCSSTFLDKIKLLFWRKIHHYYGILLGFDIPINVFGPGLRINHYGYIVVNGNARIGAFCDIHQGVNIGQGNKIGEDNMSCPIIGDNVWIGPGAKIFGGIKIADDIQIGANAVVLKTFDDSGITIGGVPAVKLSDKGNPYKRNFSD